MNPLALSLRLRSTLMSLLLGLVFAGAARYAGAWDGKTAKAAPPVKTRLDGAWRLVSSRDPRTGQMVARCRRVSR